MKAAPPWTHRAAFPPPVLPKITSTRLLGHRLYRLTKSTRRPKTTSPAASAVTTGHGIPASVFVCASRERGDMVKLRVVGERRGVSPTCERKTRRPDGSTLAPAVTPLPPR